MKLDSFTSSILANFATINNGIVINEGNELRTMSPSKTIVAEAIVPNHFDKTFGVYDIRRLLGCISLLGDPDVVLTDNHLELISNNNRVKYMYTNPATIVWPTGRITVMTEDVSFPIDEHLLSEIQKTANILTLDDLSVQGKDGDDGKIVLTLLDSSNPTSHSASFTVSGKYTKPFVAYLKVSNLKLIPGEYTAKFALTPKNRYMSMFESATKDLRYYIAIEANSNFNL